MNTALSSLVVGERIVSRCHDGPLEAEYALFDRTEVILSSAAGDGVHEQGYLTTAAFARARLGEARITAELANETLSALRRSLLRSLAVTPSVLRIVDVLGPCEAFEGGTFSTVTGRYTGTWLDLDTFAQACPLRGAAILLQALHLFLALDEVPDDVPVRLLTSGASAQGRPGERTWHPVALEAVHRLPAVLGAMRAPPRSRVPRDEADVREGLLRTLRERALASSSSRERLHTLAAAFARTGRTPPLGNPPVRLGSGEPRAYGTTPAAAAATATAPSQAQAQPSPGATPRPPPRSPLPPRPDDPTRLFEELRRHTELLRGEDHLRAVAQFLSGMADRSATVPELAMLASRAWLAAGEPAHARHFAKQLVENREASDDVRMLALEILDSTRPTQESMLPPPTAPSMAPAMTPIQPSPVVVLGRAEPERRMPPGASLPPLQPEPAPLEPPRPPPGPSHEAYVEASVEVELPPDTERMNAAPPRPFAAYLRPGGAPTLVYRPEIVETLQLPAGVTDATLAAGEVPRDPMQARVAMTRLARELGRDYRIWYGTTLKTDLLAIDAIQRHLGRRFADPPGDERSARRLEVELLRHGALLSEILARSLGAHWIDVAPTTEPGHWAMLVPPGMRIWPIGRVYRFFSQGHREADLVAFYMELEAHARQRMR